MKTRRPLLLKPFERRRAPPNLPAVHPRRGRFRSRMPPRARAALAASALVLALGRLGGGRASARDHLRLARGRPEPAPPRVPETRRAVPSPRLEDADDPGRRVANAEDRWRRVARVHPLDPARHPRPVEDEKLPAFAEAYVSGWIAQSSRLTRRRLDGRGMLAFVRERFPADERTFPTGVFRADTFRYMLLSALGGVYVDLTWSPSARWIPSSRTAVPPRPEPAAHAGSSPASRGARATRGWPPRRTIRSGTRSWTRYELAREHPMTKFNPPSVTGPEALKRWTDFRTRRGRTRVRRRTAGGAFPAVDKARSRGCGRSARG